MRKYIITMLLGLMCNFTAFAQNAADKIIGTYYAVGTGGKASKIKIYKFQDGYRAQVCWVKEPKNPDGSWKLDTKNPDKSRRNTPVSQAIIIDKVTYDDGEWTNGKVYNPEDGRRWTVTIKFKDAKTLAVRGSFLGIGKTVYWPKLQ